MRPIYIAHLDKARPVLMLTRELVIPHRQQVTVAPITTTVRGLSTEVAVGPANGIGHESVVSCDNIVTIDKNALGERIGYLFPAQEPILTAAIHAAFDLDQPGLIRRVQVVAPAGCGRMTGACGDARRGGHPAAEQQRRERLRLEAAGRFARKLKKIRYRPHLIDGCLAAAGLRIEPLISR
jgi:mRNA interferase MazF